MVVVGGEHEADPLERLGGLGGIEGDREAAVRALADAGESRAAVRFAGERQYAVPKAAGGVAPESRRKRERIRPARDDRRLERHGASLPRRAAAYWRTPNSAATMVTSFHEP